MIFLDLDGVLVDFVRGMNKALGLSPDLVANHWDWFKDAGFSFKEVDNQCTLGFWMNLPWMHDGKDILRLFDASESCLATTCMPNRASALGKQLWVKAHMPAYSRRLIIFSCKTPKKLFAASRQCLLVDDKNENVDEFIEAGGSAILVPRPWNRGYKDTMRTVEVVKTKLEEWRKEYQNDE